MTSGPIESYWYGLSGKGPERSNELAVFEKSLIKGASGHEKFSGQLKPIVPVDRVTLRAEGSTSHFRATMQIRRESPEISSKNHPRSDTRAYQLPKQTVAQLLQRCVV